MDLHPYDTERHDITRHDNCHACMHGLIHDDQLQACQSCLLGLMYVLKLLYFIRCFRVMACLGLQLVDGYIKAKLFPSLVSFSRIFLFGRISSMVRLNF